jgi:hypothetical protein
MTPAAMAGITTSPQLRESPETAKYQLPLFGSCGAGAEGSVAVREIASRATARMTTNANNAKQRATRRFIEPPANFFNSGLKRLARR